MSADSQTNDEVAFYKKFDGASAGSKVPQWQFSQYNHLTFVIDSNEPGISRLSYTPAIVLLGNTFSPLDS